MLFQFQQSPTLLRIAPYFQGQGKSHQTSKETLIVQYRWVTIVVHTNHVLLVVQCVRDRHWYTSSNEMLTCSFFLDNATSTMRHNS